MKREVLSPIIVGSALLSAGTFGYQAFESGSEAIRERAVAEVYHNQAGKGDAADLHNSFAEDSESERNLAAFTAGTSLVVAGVYMSIMLRRRQEAHQA